MICAMAHFLCLCHGGAHASMNAVLFSDHRMLRPTGSLTYLRWRNRRLGTPCLLWPSTTGSSWAGLKYTPLTSPSSASSFARLKVDTCLTTHTTTGIAKIPAYNINHGFATTSQTDTVDSLTAHAVQAIKTVLADTLWHSVQHIATAVPALTVKGLQLVVICMACSRQQLVAMLHTWCKYS